MALQGGSLLLIHRKPGVGIPGCWAFLLQGETWRQGLLLLHFILCLGFKGLNCTVNPHHLVSTAIKILPASCLYPPSHSNSA